MDLRYGDPRASLDPHVTLAQGGWFHHAPNAVLGIKVAFSLAAAFILVQIIRLHESQSTTDFEITVTLTEFYCTCSPL